MNFERISDWVDWLKKNRLQQIDLSLERVRTVADRMRLTTELAGLVVTVAGTNGKGSCVAGLESVYQAAGLQVASLTSPYLFHFNEQIRLNGQAVEEGVICEAFSTVFEKNEGLTLFELTTLAALWIFKQVKLDVCVLEVGLGGRYDAVNVVDADLAVIASIGIDHVEWLGSTREEIAREKAGIFRPGQLAVCGDPLPPHSLLDCASRLGTTLFCQQREFGYRAHDVSWDWWGRVARLNQLPLSRLALQNMSTVLMAIELFQQQCPVTRTAIEQGLQSASLKGRLEVVPGGLLHILDVSHNPAAVTWLTDYLLRIPSHGKTLAVFSMLKDKDIVSTIAVIKNHIDDWYVAPIQHERGASHIQLMNSFSQTEINKVLYCETLKVAYQSALIKAKAGDRIVVFGSFHTVAEVRPYVANILY